MKTRRPISTISYNTDHFLIAGLNDLLKRGDIAFWAFINHVPDDEVNKNHKHLYIEPDCQINTSNLIEKFEETDLNNPLPLKWLPMRYSKFDDWFLYVIHDPDYLMFKGLRQKRSYSESDLITSNDDYFNVLKHNVDRSAYSGYSGLIKSYYMGENFSDLISDGKVPLNRVVQFATVWKALSQGSIAARDKGNTNIFTGEIVDLENYKKYKEL